MLRLVKWRTTGFRWKAIAPKTPKAQAVQAEATRRLLEEEQRQKRLFRFTAEGQEQFNRLLAPIRDDIVAQGELVRKLKAEKSGKLTLDPEISKLKKLRKTLEKTENELMPNESCFDAAKFNALIKNRFFFTQSGELYGGTAGFIDFGPYGTKLKQNIINEWRRHFLNGEDKVEIETSMITNKKILAASGHVDKFADLVVKDTVNGECFRADKVVRAVLEDRKQSSEEVQNLINRLESMSKEEINEVIKDYNIKSPLSGNDLSPAIEFNLMFPCKIGPEGKVDGFLRPETAQGIFTNYKLLRNRPLPLAVGQVGHSFRNEINTGNGLVRTREFQMAEIEHFFDPEADSLISEASAGSTNIPIWSQQAQLNGRILSNLPVSSVVKGAGHESQLVIQYMAKIYQFCESIGIDKSRVRFRQQLTEELAHYSKTCFDLECQLDSVDWLECAGIAVRGEYDLRRHQDGSGQTLYANRSLSEPREEIVRSVAVKSKALKRKLQTKKAFSEVKKAVESHLEKVLQSETRESLLNRKTVTINKVEIDLLADVTITEKKQIVQSEPFVPHVVEPSFGITRLLQTVLEHCYRTRQADGRSFFTFPVTVAPIKCSILTIRKSEQMAAVADSITSSLRETGIDFESDSSGTLIGRKYLRSDEIGVPFSVVIDDDTLIYKSVTMRDRDTLYQVRLPVDNVKDVIEKLVTGKWTFDVLKRRYPSQEDFVANKAEISIDCGTVDVDDMTETEIKNLLRKYMSVAR